MRQKYVSSTVRIICAVVVIVLVVAGAVRAYRGSEETGTHRHEGGHEHLEGTESEHPQKMQREETTSIGIVARAGRIDSWDPGEHDFNERIASFRAGRPI